jgi:hypothetical protein
MSNLAMSARLAMVLRGGSGNPRGRAKSVAVFWSGSEGVDCNGELPSFSDDDDGDVDVG